MELQHPKMQEPIILSRNHKNSLSHILFVVAITLGICAFLFGLYVFVWNQQQTKNQLREEAIQNRTYDSISNNFAHFTYKESSNSAEVIDRYYLTDELDSLSKEGTFSATIKAVIPKPITRDVHLEWPKNKKNTKYAIFMRELKDSYKLTSLTTPENFVVLSIARFKDVALKIRACDAKNCSDSQEVYIPQDQVPQFVVQAKKLNGRVFLTWEQPKAAIKFNVFKRESLTEPYVRAATHTKDKEVSFAFDGTKAFYFLVQACNTSMCWSSNEVTVE